VNGFTTDLDIVWTAVGEDPTQSIPVGATKCSGLWAVRNSDWINNESSETIQVHMTPLLDIVRDWWAMEEEQDQEDDDHDDDKDGKKNDQQHQPRRIDLFKIDVEGSEMAVLHSALPLFRERRIGSVFVEIAPDRALAITPSDVALETVQSLYQAGYCFYDSLTRKLLLEQAQKLFNGIKTPLSDMPIMYAIKLC